MTVSKKLSPERSVVIVCSDLKHWTSLWNLFQLS